ncbi:MAG: hypothetical protein Q7R49_04445 [Candidatus Daviesbacteria bacterium]|nr:hypothetical protein [Candidatus Daviesbacteria bacterium]
MRNYKNFYVHKLFQMITAIVFLVLLSVYALRGILEMIVQGEGFIWLSQGSQNPFWASIPSSLANFEVSAVLVGTLLSNLLGLHLQLYYWAWLLVMMLINVLLFFLVYHLTKNIPTAFATSLIFAVNYAAQWGVIGWTYTSFLERTITVVFLIPSFIFLHRYLEGSKLWDFLAAIFLFFLALWLGQWGLIFVGAYMAYPLFWFLFKDIKTRRLLLIRILASGSFLLICAFFLHLHSINQAGVGPRYTFTYFLLHPQEFHYIERIPLQLTRWSQYPVLLKGVTTHKPFFKGSPVQYFGDIKGGNEIVWSVTLAYLMATVVIFFRLPKQRPLLFTLIFGVFSLFLINIFFGRYFPEEQSGPTRYLYLPAIWLSVFWGLFLWAVFWQKKGWISIVGLSILLGYYLINSLLLSSSFQAWMYSRNSTYSGTRALFSYIETIRPTLKPNTLIITPWDEMGCGEDTFLNGQFAKESVTFLPIYNNCAPPGGWEKVASTSSQVIKLKYDTDCKCVTEQRIK